jgi:hypothetical protein
MVLPSSVNPRLFRALLLLISALLGAAVGSAVGGGMRMLVLAAAFPALLLSAAWIRLRWSERRQRIAAQTDSARMLDQVCRSEVRRGIRDRYALAARYALQYQPDSDQRVLMEQVTRLYHEQDNTGAEAVLHEADRRFGGSPYVASRHARMLLQDLRIEEARAVIERGLTQHPDEISLLILRDGVVRAEHAGDPPEVETQVRRALAETVEWATMQLELIVGRTGARLREQLGVVVDQ